MVAAVKGFIDALQETCCGRPYSRGPESVSTPAPSIWELTQSLEYRGFAGACGGVKLAAAGEDHCAVGTELLFVISLLLAYLHNEMMWQHPIFCRYMPTRAEAAHMLPGTIEKHWKREMQKGTTSGSALEYDLYYSAMRMMGMWAMPQPRAVACGSEYDPAAHKGIKRSPASWIFRMWRRHVVPQKGVRGDGKTLWPLVKDPHCDLLTRNLKPDQGASEKIKAPWRAACMMIWPTSFVSSHHNLDEAAGETVAQRAAIMGLLSFLRLGKLKLPGRVLSPEERACIHDNTSEKCKPSTILPANTKVPYLALQAMNNLPRHENGKTAGGVCLRWGIYKGQAAAIPEQGEQLASTGSTDTLIQVLRQKAMESLHGGAVANEAEVLLTIEEWRATGSALVDSSCHIPVPLQESQGEVSPGDYWLQPKQVVPDAHSFFWMPPTTEDAKISQSMFMTRKTDTQGTVLVDEEAEPRGLEAVLCAYDFSHVVPATPDPPSQGGVTPPHPSHPLIGKGDPTETFDIELYAQYFQDWFKTLTSCPTLHDNLRTSASAKSGGLSGGLCPGREVTGDTSGQDCGCRDTGEHQWIVKRPGEPELEDFLQQLKSNRDPPAPARQDIPGSRSTTPVLAPEPDTRKYLTPFVRTENLACYLGTRKCAEDTARMYEAILNLDKNKQSGQPPDATLLEQFQENVISKGCVQFMSDPKKFLEGDPRFRGVFLVTDPAWFDARLLPGCALQSTRHEDYGGGFDVWLVLDANEAGGDGGLMAPTLYAKMELSNPDTMARAAEGGIGRQVNNDIHCDFAVYRFATAEDTWIFRKKYVTIRPGGLCDQSLVYRVPWQDIQRPEDARPGPQETLLRSHGAASAEIVIVNWRQHQQNAQKLAVEAAKTMFDAAEWCESSIGKEVCGDPSLCTGCHKLCGSASCHRLAAVAQPTMMQACLVCLLNAQASDEHLTIACQQTFLPSALDPQLYLHVNRLAGLPTAAVAFVRHLIRNVPCSALVRWMQQMPHTWSGGGPAVSASSSDTRESRPASQSQLADSRLMSFLTGVARGVVPLNSHWSLLAEWACFLTATLTSNDGASGLVLVVLKKAADYVVVPARAGGQVCNTILTHDNTRFIVMSVTETEKEEETFYSLLNAAQSATRGPNVWTTHGARRLPDLPPWLAKGIRAVAAQATCPIQHSTRVRIIYARKHQEQSTSEAAALVQMLQSDAVLQVLEAAPQGLSAQVDSGVSAPERLLRFSLPLKEQVHARAIDSVWSTYLEKVIPHVGIQDHTPVLGGAPLPREPGFPRLFAQDATEITAADRLIVQNACHLSTAVRTIFAMMSRSMSPVVKLVCADSQPDTIVEHVKDFTEIQNWTKTGNWSKAKTKGNKQCDMAKLKLPFPIMDSQVRSEVPGYLYSSHRQMKAFTYTIFTPQQTLKSFSSSLCKLFEVYNDAKVGNVSQDSFTAEWLRFCQAAFDYGLRAFPNAPWMAVPGDNTPRPLYDEAGTTLVYIWHLIRAEYPQVTEVLRERHRFQLSAVKTCVCGESEEAPSTPVSSETDAHGFDLSDGLLWTLNAHGIARGPVAATLDGLIVSHLDGAVCARSSCTCCQLVRASVSEQLGLAAEEEMLNYLKSWWDTLPGRGLAGETNDAPPLPETMSSKGWCCNDYRRDVFQWQALGKTQETWSKDMIAQYELVTRADPKTAWQFVVDWTLLQRKFTTQMKFLRIPTTLTIRLGRALGKDSPAIEVPEVLRLREHQEQNGGLEVVLDLTGAMCFEGDDNTSGHWTVVTHAPCSSTPYCWLDDGTSTHYKSQSDVVRA